MTTVTIADKTIILDDDGFLTNSEDWDEGVARELAAQEGISTLDQEQMEIIKTLRSHYQRHKSFPILASVCKKIGSRTRDCVAEDFINPMKAWRIAGLPKPPNIFFTSFDGKTYVPNPVY